MAALVAAAFGQLGAPLPLGTARLAERTAKPLIVAVAVVAAIAVASVVATFAGALLAPRLTPEAKQLLLGAALVVAGIGVLFPGKIPSHERSAGLLGRLLILVITSDLLFVVATLAAAAALPWLTPVGATLGTGAVTTAAAMLGEAGWRRLPLVAPRRGAAALFLLTGAWLGLRALSLI